MDEDFKSDLQAIDQISKLFVEIEEKDHKITKHSVCFYQEITNNLVLSQISNDAKTNINQFLYMINANYFEEIKGSHKTLTREELINRIIEQIGLYLSSKNISTFTVKEAEEAVKSCFFIEDSLKKQIIKEFKKAERTLSNGVSYHIYDKNIDTNKHAREQIQETEVTNESIQHNLSLFDVNDIEWYEFLLKCFGKDSESTKEYGEVSSVEWHLFTLRVIMSFTLNNFPQELTNIKGEFYNSQVVMDFV